MSMDAHWKERMDNAEESEAAPGSQRFMEFVSVKVEEIKEEPKVKHEQEWEGDIVNLTVEPEFLTEYPMCVKEEPGESETTTGPKEQAVKALTYGSMSMDAHWKERMDNAEESEAAPGSQRFMEFVSVKVEEIKEEPKVKHEQEWEGDIVNLTVEPEFLTEYPMCVKEEPGESETTTGPKEQAVKALTYAGSRSTEDTSEAQHTAFVDDLQDVYPIGVTDTQRFDLCQQVQCLRASNTYPENIHESVETREKPYSENTLPNASNSPLNSQKRAKKKPWPCDTCNKAYTRKDHLKTHQLIHSKENGSTPKPFTCDICKKNFPKLSSLKVHERLHTGIKPYACETCKREFTQLGHLNTHMLVHTGLKPYSCEICKKEFSQSSNLNAHKLTHEEVRNRTMPYACEICGKKFSKMSNLKRHSLLHTGQKLYSCEICNKEFAQSSNLNVHKLIHTGEKRHTCDVCDKKFLLKSMLKAHRRIHTGERPHHCDICNKNYTRKSDLRIHKRIHSRDT